MYGPALVTGMRKTPSESVHVPPAPQPVNVSTCTQIFGSERAEVESMTCPSNACAKPGRGRATVAISRSNDRFMVEVRWSGILGAAQRFTFSWYEAAGHPG